MTKGVRRALRGGAQRGFTVIELMLVVSILGIVAAALTTGLVGVTYLVRQHSAGEERTAVQHAYTDMLRAQKVPVSHDCDGAAGPGQATDDMRRLAGATSPVAGAPAHHPVALYPAYIGRVTTRYHYYCTGRGVVTAADAP